MLHWGIMGTIHIRNVNEALIKALKIRAVNEGKSMREVILEYLEGTKPAKTATRVIMEESNAPGTTRCKRCDSIVYRDPKNVKYWRCDTCKRQLEFSEIICFQ